MKDIKLIIQNLLNELKDIKSINAKILDMLVDKQLNKMLDIDTHETSANPPEISDTFKIKIASQGNKEFELLHTQLSKSYVTMLDTAIALNNELVEPFPELKKIQLAKEKEIINVEEFELLYSYGKEAQKGFRSRIKNPLPRIPGPHGSKILYHKNEVEKWLSKK